jgi:hypothetical protein
VGYLIDPPKPIEGAFVAVFAQTDLSDGLAVSFLRDHGIDARTFPLGDLVYGVTSGAPLFGESAVVCVPREHADEALDLLEFDSGLVDDDGDVEEDL